MKNLLVTGGYGFLGRNIALFFKNAGFYVTGIGRSSWKTDEYQSYGFSSWVDGEISFELLKSVEKIPDLIIHCGGGGAVAFADAYPFEDFRKSVLSTAAVLEYMRVVAPTARLIYPSSPAVHGSLGKHPIQPTALFKPVSTYGLHKKIAEELCQNYRERFGLDISIIRFFSLFGNGLQKQLLWDACKKISSGEKHVEFWGTGEETRDFLHISDAVSLLLKVGTCRQKNLIINGGSGTAHSVREILTLIAGLLKPGVEIRFNQQTRPGDPQHYHAAMSEALSLGWKPETSLEKGLESYVNWYKQCIIK